MEHTERGSMERGSRGGREKEQGGEKGSRENGTLVEQGAGRAGAGR